MDPVMRLSEIEAIKCLKAQYFRGVDGKDWDLLAAVLAPDIVCDYCGSATDPASGVNYAGEATETVLHGSAAVIEGLRHSLDGVATAHMGYMPEIEIVSPDRATGVWGMHDTLRFPPGHAIRELRGYGHYVEDYVRIGGAWRIAALRIRRLRIDILS